MTNQLFFTITSQNDETHFTSDQYKFTIKHSEQQVGTRGKALWYYRFDHPPTLIWSESVGITRTMTLKVESIYS